MIKSVFATFLLSVTLSAHAELVLIGDPIEVPEDQANQERSPYISNGHALAMFDDGRFVVVWNEQENFVPLGKYRVFGADGLPETPATLFSTGIVIPVAPAVTIPGDAPSKGPSPLFVTAAIIDDLTKVEVQSFGTGGGARDTVAFSTGVENIDVSATVTGGLSGTVVAGLLTREVEFAGFSAKRTPTRDPKRLVSASGRLAATLKPTPTKGPFELQPEVQFFDDKGFLGEPLVIQKPLANIFNADVAHCGSTAAFMYVAATPGFIGNPNPVLALIEVGAGDELTLRSVERDELVPSAVSVSVACNQVGQFASAVGAPQPAGPVRRGEMRPGIVLRGFGATGLPQGAAIIPRMAPTGGLATSVAINDNGFGVVVWSDIQAQQPSDQGVYAQLFRIEQEDLLFADGFETGMPIR